MLTPALFTLLNSLWFLTGNPLLIALNAFLVRASAVPAVSWRVGVVPHYIEGSKEELQVRI